MTRVAVLTGAARGIGAAVATSLAQQGWSLALGDVCCDDDDLGYRLGTQEELTAVGDQCRAAGAEVVTQVCDVRDAAAVERLVAAAAELGQVEAAVAAAGVLGGSGPAWTLSDAVLDRDLAVNYRGVVALARAAVPRLLGAGEHGRFVAVVSAAGVTGLPLLGSYTAAKHAALGYVRSLAADLGRTGVTANAVLPGSTETAMLSATAAVYDLLGPEAFARHARSGRLLRPEEVAAAVVWLTSREASGVTGTALAVDGGFTG
jgi:SDR family mycofactocin-dependent oxidoreductase